jgi:hypothetical protein
VERSFLILRGKDKRVRLSYYIIASSKISVLVPLVTSGQDPSSAVVPSPLLGPPGLEVGRVYILDMRIAPREADCGWHMRAGRYCLRNIHLAAVTAADWSWTLASRTSFAVVVAKVGSRAVVSLCQSQSLQYCSTVEN